MTRLKALPKRSAAPPRATGTEIIKACLDALGTYRQIFAWRQNVGAAKVMNAGGGSRFVRFGLAGSGDITGIVGPWGRRLEIEVKAEGDRLSPVQVAFGERVRECGGIYLVVSSAAEMARELGALGVRW